MNEVEIKAEMQAASDKFNQLKAQADEIDGQLKNLQGEYAAYEKMLAKLANPPAATVDAEPTLKAEDKKTTVRK